MFGVVDIDDDVLSCWSDWRERRGICDMRCVVVLLCWSAGRVGRGEEELGTTTRRVQ